DVNLDLAGMPFIDSAVLQVLVCTRGPRTRDNSCFRPRLAAGRSTIEVTRRSPLASLAGYSI
ncbi:MAG: hypothetical protein M3Z46_05300, partial [Actinomycetota bacterium]|nr:hypothetical protein [Actinomycetota bacterium]